MTPNSRLRHRKTENAFPLVTCSGGAKDGNPWPRFIELYSLASWANSVQTFEPSSGYSSLSASSDSIVSLVRSICQAKQMMTTCH